MLRAKGLGEKRQLVRVVRISLACERALGSSGRKRELLLRAHYFQAPATQARISSGAQIFSEVSDAD